MLLKKAQLFIRLSRFKNHYFCGYESQINCLPSMEVAVRSESRQTHQQKFTATQQEVHHHDILAADWWNVDGVMRALHALNEIRVPFIRDGLVARGNVDATLINTPRVLTNQQILEVGCGGGILTEQLARLGAVVTALDLGDQLIKTAREHLEKHSPELQPNITYKLEDVAIHAISHREKYDAVVVSEVLEHIADKPTFLTHCIEALKPGGSIFISTLNKTVLMWIGGIVVAEYILRLVPMGTHHWDKLITPLDVQRILDALNCQTVLINGSAYDFTRNTWHWINSTILCYAIQAIKDGQ